MENPVNTARVACPKLAEFPPGDIAAICRAFEPAIPCVLRQAWRGTPEADFAPGSVRMGWRGDSLLVLAEFSDTDIFTNATKDNERFWELGDTFEIFLRPEGQVAYVEFHVTPNNHRLQLRFGRPEVLEHVRQSGSVSSVLVHPPAFSSTTWIQPELQRWIVFAEIPARSVCDHSGSLANSQWHFSFGRYDCTRGRKEPVISSTSAHREPSFHRQHEWGLMQFAP